MVILVIYNFKSGAAIAVTTANGSALILTISYIYFFKIYRETWSG
jgi:hypothetical protein